MSDGHVMAFLFLEQSWVFAWMDSSRQRYLVYSIVYLAPYLRFELVNHQNGNFSPQILTSFVLIIEHLLGLRAEYTDLMSYNIVRNSHYEEKNSKPF